jgi:hypothetical protein
MFDCCEIKEKNFCSIFHRPFLANLETNAHDWPLLKFGQVLPGPNCQA